MVLESTMICCDNSDYQRNGDYYPTRLSMQKDAIHLICRTKIRMNAENDIGLMTISNSVQVLATLTNDVGSVCSKMHLVEPKGELNLLTGIKIAHLVLKHRQGKNYRMRVVAFVGSPINDEEDELVKLGKRLKKEKVNVDIVSFGGHEKNLAILNSFVNALNGKEKTSQLLIVPRGSGLSEALLASPIIGVDDGSCSVANLESPSFELGVDPNVDPELAMVLRASIEEQRQHEESERGAAQAAADNATGNASAHDTESELYPTESNLENAMLQRAYALSAETAENLSNFENLTEEEQIKLVMSMSMEENTDDPDEIDIDHEYLTIIRDPLSLESETELDLTETNPESQTDHNSEGTSSNENKDAEENKANVKEKSDDKKETNYDDKTNK